MPDEKIIFIKTPNYSITPNLSYYDPKTKVKFDRSCLKQDKVTFNHGKVVNIYIVYKIIILPNISKYSSNNDYPALGKMLFGAVSLTGNADINRYKHFGNGIGLDRRWGFSLESDGDGQNIIIFEVDMRSCYLNSS